MTIAVLFPRFDHPAIEERFATWQSEWLLREGDTPVLFYDLDELAAAAASAVEAEHVLVVTDPLLLAAPGLGKRLAAVLASSSAQAAVPVTNEAANPAQHRAADVPYMTLRELQSMTERWHEEHSPPRQLIWDASDAGAFLIRTERLDQIRVPMGRALAGLEVVVSPADYAHRWSSMRGQVRSDLLERISVEARSILEIGCGEAPLGAALKQRQRCRVVGVELDQRAAAIARKRIDDVYCADVREIVTILNEQFDWIIGGDIVEHLDDPWSFLGDLRALSTKGGHLLLSLPNVASASVVADLLAGRFDYVYMGLTCAGHLRFFTRRTIEETLMIAGWKAVSIEPQLLPLTPQATELMERMTGAGIPFSREDLTASGYYVTAQNR